jgi:penicillin amidase
MIGAFFARFRRDQRRLPGVNRWACSRRGTLHLDSGNVSWTLVRSTLLWILGIVLTVALVASTLALWAVRRAFPEQDGELDLPGLSAPVSVFRDGYGVPQLYASTPRICSGGRATSRQDRF